MVELKEIERDLQQRLSKKRFIHTLGVVEAAITLAKQYGGDEDKAHIAALLHDCAKEMSLQEMKAFVSDMSLDEDILSNGALLHGVAGMALAKSRYGVTDQDILEAIRVHTTGKEDMSLLDKIIFLADYIEANRDFPGVNDIRLAAQKSLNEGVLSGYDTTIRHLLDQGVPIYPLTIIGRNDILRRIKGGN